MTDTQKSAGYPAPDESRIEDLLSKVQPMPSKTFTQKMQNAPWKAAQKAQPKNTMKFKLGELLMNKRSILSTGFAILVLAVVVIASFSNIAVPSIDVPSVAVSSVANSHNTNPTQEKPSISISGVTSVSAKSILDGAAQIQAQGLPTEGILHYRFETLYNSDALPEDQVAGTIMDAYYDLVTCSVRSVTTNSKTGVVLDVHSDNGTHTYGGFNYDLNFPGPLTVYRSPSKGVTCKSWNLNFAADENMFKEMRDAANIELVGQETWEGGRTVYVLRTKNKNNSNLHISYFDAKTYQFLGGKQVTVNQDGSEIVTSKKLYYVSEILPVGSPINWDLSDLNNINIVDDPDGTHYDDGGRG